MHRLVIALTTFLALTGGVFLGYHLLFAGAADRAAPLVPANAAVYVNVYLQPSAGQQANLSGLIGRLPGFADEATLDEKVDQIAQNLLTGLGVDYRTDLKPWVGDQVAVAAWFGDEETPVQRAVAIADVKDVAAMESALADVAERQGESFAEETYGGVALHVGTATTYAVVAEMLVVSDTPEGVRAVIDTQSGAANLASRGDFREAMGRIPADHLASAFVDAAMLAAGGGTTDPTGAFTTLAAALVADRDGLRVTGTAPMPPADPGATATAGASPRTPPLAEWMPRDTIAEVVVFGLRGMLADAEDAASGTPQGQELSDALSTLRTLAAFGLGIDLDADVLPLFDGETALALSAIEDGAPRGQLLLRPQDVEVAAAVLDRVADALAGAGGTRRVESTDAGVVTVVTVPQLGDIAYATVDEVVILGLSVEDVGAAAEAHVDGTTLAASEAYVAAFEPIGSRGATEVYADVRALLEIIGIADTLPVDARAILSQLGTFSATARSADDQIEFNAVLTIDEDGTD